MRIKESNKWKAALIIHIGVYQPTVMYFGLTNSTIFQTMMNNLFCNMISQENMVTFIDDIIVATDTEKEHDELVEKVLKRLEKNNLFVKPEVSIESKRGRILRHSDWSPESWNAKGKGRWSVKLAGTKECKRDTKISRTCQLLQTVY